MITIFNDLFVTDTPFHKDISYALNLIKNNNDNELIEGIRTETDKDKRNALKKKLKCICFSGEFSQRKAINIISHSGYICLDWDDVDDPSEWKDKLKENEFIYAAFISPSGNGVKAIVQVPPVIKDHKAYYEAISEAFDSTNDTHTSSIASVCYESYDPDVYINKDANIWIVKKEYEEFAPTDDIPEYFKINGVDKKVEVILSWFNKKFALVEGSRNTNLFKLAAALNKAGMAKDQAEYLLINQYSAGLKKSEINAIVNSAYKNTAEFGTLQLLDTAKKDYAHKLFSRGDHKAKKKLLKEGVSEDEIEELEDFNFEDDMLTFWDVNNKGAIVLNDFKFKLFLENRGFFKVQLNDTEFTFVRVKDNLINEINETNIKDFVLDHVENIDLSAYNFFARSTGKFTESYLNMLSTRELNMLRDSHDTSYLFFSNVIAKVTKDKVETIEYIDCGGLVWEKNVINRSYHHSDGTSDFETFISNVSNADANRKLVLERAIGYLINGYKNQDEGLAIILYDETLNDNPNGRTGKTIISNAIKEVRKLTTLNGKEFNSKGQFPYQTVNLDDNVLCFDDLDRSFNFEDLFSVITGDITLNKKNLQPIVIPYERSPKILFTSNYILKGIGDSHDARKIEIELYRHYHKDFRPIDDFGKKFFSHEWSKDDWNNFYGYMINCLQYYLTDGLEKPDLPTAKIRKLIASTSEDFYEFAESIKWNTGVAYKTREIFSDFKSDDDRAENMSKNMNSKWFGRWISDYFEFKGWRKEDGNANGTRYFNVVIDNLPF